MPFCSIRSNINTTFELCAGGSAVAGGTNNRKQFSGQGGKDISRKSCEFQHWEGVKERTSDHPFLLFSCLRRKGFTWHSDWTSLTSIPRFWLATSSVVLFCQTHDKFLWYPNSVSSRARYFSSFNFHLSSFPPICQKGERNPRQIKETRRIWLIFLSQQQVLKWFFKRSVTYHISRIGTISPSSFSFDP